MSNGRTRPELVAEIREILRLRREAFMGLYKAEIKSLLAISRADIEAITPDDVDLEKYDELMEVVKDASRKNLEQAALKERIIALGEVAVKIARHVPSLSNILGD